MKFRSAWLPSLVAVGVLLAGLAGFLSTAEKPPDAGDDRPGLLLAGAESAAVHGDEPIRPLPEPPALDPEKVALGRLLFHDKRLSADNSIACVSCHDLGRGGADGRVVSTGVGGVAGEVNAPGILTAALNFRQFWDGRAASLEEQAGGPIVNPKEMASTWGQVLGKLQADPQVREAFRRLYADGLTADNVRSAIADFERSLPRPSRFDRWLKGDLAAISGDEESGYQLFKKYGCIGCHQGANVGGNLYQRFGIMAPYYAEKGAFTKADLGRYNLTGKEEDRYVFKVPSLRNVALTAPYFHDGSAPQLEDAVAIMGRYQLGIDLPPGDVKLIAAFLASLSGEAAP
jgi:cytochrome c peroxidase